MGYVFGLSLCAKSFSYYAVTFLPPGSAPIWANVFVTAIVHFFTAINFIGSKAVGKSEIFIVSIKVGFLILFTVAGILYMNPENLTISNWPSSKNVFFGTRMVFLAYQGFGLITNAAEDIKNPEKAIPRALYLSVMLVILIYVSVSLTVLGNLSVS